MPKRKRSDLLFAALLKILMRKKLITFKELAEEVRRIRKVDHANRRD